jgi:hypothetical protein
MFTALFREGIIGVASAGAFEPPPAGAIVLPIIEASPSVKVISVVAAPVFAIVKAVT